MSRRIVTWHRLLSVSARPAKELKAVAQRVRPRPIVVEKPKLPKAAIPKPVTDKKKVVIVEKPKPPKAPVEKKKPNVVLPRVNRPAPPAGVSPGTASPHAAPNVAAPAVAYQEMDIDPLAPPSMRTLQLLALQRGVPFIGFGFMDNAIMIVSGDYIEMSIGVTLGISTLCAAALGNVIADVLGLNLGGVIEELSYKLGVPEPRLSRPQMEMKITRVVAFLGSSLGIAFGCLVGMLPLAVIALMDRGEGESESHRESTPKAVFVALAQRLTDVLHCDRAVVYEVDPDTGAIRGHFSKQQGVQPPLPPFVSREVVERVLVHHEGISLVTSTPPASSEDPKSSKVTNSEWVRSVLCMPVLDLDGRVIAVVAAINRDEGSARPEQAIETGEGPEEQGIASPCGAKEGVAKGFGPEDARVMGGVCVQVAAAIINLTRRPEEQVSFVENLKLLRAQQGIATHTFEA